jgi:hypothetical protein
VLLDPDWSMMHVRILIGKFAVEFPQLKALVDSHYPTNNSIVEMGVGKTFCLISFLLGVYLQAQVSSKVKRSASLQTIAVA